jgi:nitrile hydratase subunit alpha
MSGGHAELPVAARVRAFEERVIAAGLTTDAELEEILAGVYASASPVNGARMIARAWADPAYRDRLLTDANDAAAELGFGPGVRGYLLKVVENTPSVHNVIVCTLCSCYPTSLLGPSPTWYKSFAYRSRVVREPRAVLAEFGLELPAGTEIRVWDANSETRYLVLPMPPESADGLDEDALASLVSRNGLIGTAAR